MPDPHRTPHDAGLVSAAHASTERSSAPRWAMWAATLFVASLAMVPFWPARHFELVWDDPFLLEQLEAKQRSGGMAAVVGSEFRVLQDRPTGYYRPFTAWTLLRDARPAWGGAHGDQVVQCLAQSRDADPFGAFGGRANGQ